MELLGMKFTSIWLALLYMLVFCALGTVFERLSGRWVKRRLGTGGAAKAVRFVLFGLFSVLVLWGLDKLMDSVSVAWGTILGLAAVMAAVMTLPPEEDAPAQQEEQ